MALRLGDVAPDFEQDTSIGRIRFSEWLGNSFGAVPHRRTFAPVCTTELGYTAKLEQFDQRNVKVLALSVDPVDSHKKWINDINGIEFRAPPSTFRSSPIRIARFPSSTT